MTSPDTPSSHAPSPAEPSRPQSLLNLFCSFTHLALQGFGGVVAVLQRELIEKKLGGWSVRGYQKFCVNSNLAKSPTRTLQTQSNHVFMAIYATLKLECLGIPNKLNPFALCRKLLINASRCAYAQLQLFRTTA